MHVYHCAKNQNCITSVYYFEFVLLIMQTGSVPSERPMCMHHADWWYHLHFAEG